MNGRPVVKYVSIAAAALALVAIGLAVWDLIEGAGNARDSIRILLLAAAVLFVAGISLRRGTSSSDGS
jgi:hypothetical protein